MSHTDEERKQIKEVIAEVAEQTVGYQPKPDHRGWFNEECKIATDENNAAYMQWTDKATASGKLEYVRLQKVAHKVCENKRKKRLQYKEYSIKYKREQISSA